MLHYNFPPYSVGETGRMARPRAGARSAMASSPGGRSARCCRRRRNFYTIRTVSEIHRVERLLVDGDRLRLLSLALTWTPAFRWKRPTAGIAMGLILEDKRFAVLSDILGDEDHLGDMDFAVAGGTTEGVTSLQMDIKIAGITEEIMKVALGQAKDGRLHILGEMSKALTGARAELGEFAPRIETR